MTEPAPEPASEGTASSAPIVVGSGFPHAWRVTLLKQRPLILPRRRYVYPRDAEEVERGALELLIHPPAPVLEAIGSQEMEPAPEPFLATCALGFADPLAPTGVWSCPHPNQLCAVAGGYAYLIDTTEPSRFEQVAYRPVLAVRQVPAGEASGRALLLFVGHQAILAYDLAGRAWETVRLSSDGIEMRSIAGGLLHGAGWDMWTDKETPFTIELATGELLEQQG